MELMKRIAQNEQHATYLFGGGQLDGTICKSPIRERGIRKEKEML